MAWFKEFSSYYILKQIVTYCNNHSLTIYFILFYPDTVTVVDIDMISMSFWLFNDGLQVLKGSAG